MRRVLIGVALVLAAIVGLNHAIDTAREQAHCETPPTDVHDAAWEQRADGHAGDLALRPGDDVRVEASGEETWIVSSWRGATAVGVAELKDLYWANCETTLYELHRGLDVGHSPHLIDQTLDGGREVVVTGADVIDSDFPMVVYRLRVVGKDGGVERWTPAAAFHLATRP